jgi:hypothetical protein
VWPFPSLFDGTVAASGDPGHCQTQYFHLATGEVGVLRETSAAQRGRRVERPDLSVRRTGRGLYEGGAVLQAH